VADPDSLAAKLVQGLREAADVVAEVCAKVILLPGGMG
jgi:hypothetical protein